MLSLLYLCSVTPNASKSILKFDTVYSKNSYLSIEKEKNPVKLAIHYKLLHKPFSTPDLFFPPLFFFFFPGTRFMVNGSGDRNI